jgi:hypothetical protein
MNTTNTQWPTATIDGQLDYISGKLGLIPAFGDSIGKAVNKAELSLCQKYANNARKSNVELLAALEWVAARLERGGKAATSDAIQQARSAISQARGEA